MTKHHHPGLRSVHRALADPMRVRLLECLWGRPQSVKELAAWAGLAPDRLYYHLAQLEQARLIEIAEYRRLPGGKVERVYRPTPVEPPGDEATPLEFAEFLGAMLEATRADITAASLAKQAGERREITLLRTTVRLSEVELITLREQLFERVRQAQEKPDDEGVWTRVVVTLVDLQDRGQPTSKGEFS
ncbi:MAG: helix-turn-helix domain-containing protein [Ktedonobacteraceae bacterium]